jgi:hypothetical protein
MVVVAGGFGEGVDSEGVLVFAPGGEHAEVGEDVVLGVGADPCSDMVSKGLLRLGNGGVL